MVRVVRAQLYHVIDSGIAYVPPPPCRSATVLASIDAGVEETVQHDHAVPAGVAELDYDAAEGVADLSASLCDELVETHVVRVPPDPPTGSAKLASCDIAAPSATGSGSTAAILQSWFEIFAGSSERLAETFTVGCDARGDMDMTHRLRRAVDWACGKATRFSAVNRNIDFAASSNPGGADHAVRCRLFPVRRRH